MCSFSKTSSQRSWSLSKCPSLNRQISLPFTFVPVPTYIIFSFFSHSHSPFLSHSPSLPLSLSFSLSLFLSLPLSLSFPLSLSLFPLLLLYRQTSFLNAKGYLNAEEPLHHLPLLQYHQPRYANYNKRNSTNSYSLSGGGPPAITHIESKTQIFSSVHHNKGRFICETNMNGLPDQLNVSDLLYAVIS